MSALKCPACAHAIDLPSDAWQYDEEDEHYLPCPSCATPLKISMELERVYYVTKRSVRATGSQP